MSLLRRNNQTPSPFDDDEDVTGTDSPLLSLTSAWSVWKPLTENPVFKTLAENTQLSAEPRYPEGAWAVIGNNGVIYANPLRAAPADEWLYVLGHLLAHLGLRHVPGASAAMTAIYELTANALVAQLGMGTPPEGFLMPSHDWRTDAKAVYADWQRSETVLPEGWITAAGSTTPDIIDGGSEAVPADVWGMMLTRGLLENIGGKGGLAPWATVGASLARQELHWFTKNFPLLSALASHFEVIEDRDTIRAFQIETAAVIAERMEILVNPEFKLSQLETRFVMAHEMLHVGLLHHKRQENRNHFVWNVACDYVINAWLKDMGVGEMPKGGLYNPAFAGLSSDAIYEKLMADPDFVRRLVTFRGVGVGDILPPGARGNARRIGNQLAADLAEELMEQGIKAHVEGKGGLLPAELLELVTAKKVAAPAWKMALSKWFDAHFEESLPARSYARQSRRQQATPDIPRPRYALPQLPDGSSIFGVMLDTSGSMSNDLLSKCLGAIAALAAKYRIRQVRLVYCDAMPYDEGYVPIKKLTEPIKVKGRGGTKLQPGVDLLTTAKDFPKDAPILIITDAQCDHLTVRRDHAFLIPEGRRLPFAPEGPVFHLK